MKLPSLLCWFSLELVRNLSSSLLNADRQECAEFHSAGTGRNSWGQIFGSERQWTAGGDMADEHSDPWHFPEMSLVWRTAGAFPSHSCHPNNQIILAGALIWWMLHFLYKLSNSSRREPKKIPCNEQKKDLNLSLLHWDEYLHVYFLN